MKAHYTQLWELETDDTCPEPLIVTMEQTTIDELDLIEGNVKPTKPVVFRRAMGRYAKDVLATTGHSRMLFSSRVVRAMADGGFSGWSTYPVRVLDHRGEVIPGYHGISVAGRAGAQDTARSERIPSSRSKLVRLRGLFFVNDEWDGSDVFLSAHWICVTQRVYETVSALKPTNLCFVRLENLACVEIPSVGRTG